MTKKVFFSRHSGGVTIYMGGKPLTVSGTHPHFQKILEALRTGAYDIVEKLIDVSGTINSLGASKKFEGRRVFVERGRVYYNNHEGGRVELAGPLVDRILDDIAKPSAEKYADALIAFCDNVMKNTKKDIRDELWEFLASGKTPITMDGCFLAYKKVKTDYKDIYTGTMDNTPGRIVRVAYVDPDRHNTCSTGLHFCSRGYLGSYGMSSGTKIVVVKVNPKDVYAIPTDYSFQKGRASEYYVVGEVSSEWDYSSDVFKDSFIDEDTKVEAAPKVAFKAPLRASLASLAQSYGLLDSDGRVRVVDSGGEWIPVRDNGRSGLTDVIGTPVSGEVRLMSIETKSVRAALKAAVEKAQGS